MPRLFALPSPRSLCTVPSSFQVTHLFFDLQCADAPGNENQHLGKKISGRHSFFFPFSLSVENSPIFPKDNEDEKNGCLEPHREIRSFLFVYIFFPFLQTILLHPGSTKDNALVSFSPPPNSVSWRRRLPPFPLGLSHAIPSPVPPVAASAAKPRGSFS